MHPLKAASVMGFAAAKDLDISRAFYEGKLGLRCISQDRMALRLDCEGADIRIQKIPDHKPVQFTVLGWKVKDIRSTVARLTAAKVKVERYTWMTMQDDSGVASFPNGDMVAWFKDPDDNVLSIAQMAE